MQIPQYGDTEAEEKSEVEPMPKAAEEPEVEAVLSKSEMQEFISQYKSKVESLEQLVDEAAEAEDYDKAEELQDELDKLQEKD